MPLTCLRAQLRSLYAQCLDLTLLQAIGGSERTDQFASVLEVPSESDSSFGDMFSQDPCKRPTKALAKKRGRPRCFSSSRRRPKRQSVERGNLQTNRRFVQRTATACSWQSSRMLLPAAAGKILFSACLACPGPSAPKCDVFARRASTKRSTQYSRSGLRKPRHLGSGKQQLSSAFRRCRRCRGARPQPF